MKMIKQIVICLAVAASTGVQAGDNDNFLAMVEAEAAHADVVVAGDTAVGSDSELMMQRLDELKQVSPSAYSIYQKLQPHHKAEVHDALIRGDDIYLVRELIILRNG